MIARSLSRYLLLFAVLFAAVACQQAAPQAGDEIQQPPLATAVDTDPASSPATPTASSLPAATAVGGALPPPPPLVLNGSQPQGTASVVGELTYGAEFLLRIDARRSSAPAEPGAGIARVEFRISSASVADLYTFVDYTPAYCVFGGGEPDCHTWPLVDGVFRWGEGGPPVEPGQYAGQAIFHEPPGSDDGVEDVWNFTFEIAAP